jgi:hypothetical protein
MIKLILYKENGKRKPNLSPTFIERNKRKRKRSKETKSKCAR